MDPPDRHIPGMLGFETVELLNRKPLMSIFKS